MKLPKIFFELRWIPLRQRRPFGFKGDPPRGNFMMKSIIPKHITPITAQKYQRKILELSLYLQGITFQSCS